MPLPSNRKRQETIAGGTAVGQESHTSLWLGLAALALVAAGVGFAAMGGEKKSAPAASEIGEATNEPEDVESPDEAPAPETGEVGISLDEAPPSESERRREARVSFEQGLSDARLWATVSLEGTTLSLVSGACSDENMRPTISKFAPALAEAGFTAVRCHEKHGAQVFEQGL